MPYIKFDANNLAGRIAALPLILCGPILRRVTATSATVWVALKRSSDVTLTIYDGTKELFASAATSPAKIGEHLYVVAVTATAPTDQPLVRGKIYGYDLTFDTGDLTAAGVYSSAGGLSALCYGTHIRPTFVIPPPAWHDLHIAHGSCRKFHGQGRDALPAAGVMIQQSATDAAFRPQFLLMTGDQIYADDVASAVLFMLRDVGATLLGRADTLPGVDAATSLEPGQRAAVVLDTLFLTPDEKSARNHLLHLYEFCAMYLMAWSDVLWPATNEDFPTYKDVFGTDGKEGDVTAYAAQLAEVQEFRTTLAEVRKVLANIPCYMIFDDHEVTDDWYISADWCARVLGNDAGRKFLQNAMCAYALFQAWGNTPKQFDVVGSPGQKLLVETAKGAAASNQLVDWLLNIPPKAQIFDPSIFPSPSPTKATDLTDAMKPTLPNGPELHRPALAAGTPPDWLTWHFTINATDYQFIFLDTRTWRSYPGPGGFYPPQLLSNAAWTAQVVKDAAPPGPPPQITFVISPAVPLAVPVVERFTEERTLAEVLEKDIEGWNAQTASFQLLLARFATRALGAQEPPPLKRRIVILSGDVHHAFAIRLSYWATIPYLSGNIPAETVFALLTASAFKNQHDGITDTIGLHDHGYEMFYLANKRDWINYFGWQNPARARTKVGTMKPANQSTALAWKTARATPSVQCAERLRGARGTAKLTTPPEWRYAVHYLDSKALVPATTTPTTGPGKQAVATGHQQHKKYVDIQAPGMQIVGRNNMGEITFRFADGNTQLARIGQRLWWRNPPDGDPGGRTFHIVSLEFGDTQYPDPLTTVGP